MTSVAEPEAETRIRTIVFMPSGRGDCAASARMSFEDYLRLDIDGIAEWVDGEARVDMPVSRRHQVIVDFLNRLIGLYIELRGGGVLHSAPYVLRATEAGPGREPDLMFVRPEHRDRLLASHAAGPVDLAIEVVSPDGVERDYVQKFREYEAAGIPEYWVIDSRPGQEHADFFVLQKGAYERAVLTDGVFRSTVVDGFWLRTDWLWDPEPRVALALEQLLGRSLT